MKEERENRREGEWGRKKRRWREGRKGRQNFVLHVFVSLLSQNRYKLDVEFTNLHFSFIKYSNQVPWYEVRETLYREGGGERSKRYR